MSFTLTGYLLVCCIFSCIRIKWYKMHLRLLLPLCVATLILLPAPSGGYSILALMGLGTKSHFTVLRPLLEELITRGHNITLLSLCPSNLGNIEEFVLDEVTDMAFNNPFEKNSSSTLAMFWTYRNIFKDAVRSILDSEVFFRFSEQIRGRHYDVVILSAHVNDFLLPIAYNFSAPIVLISPPTLSLSLAWEFNVPTPHSYVPSLFGNTQPPFTIFERFINALVDFIASASMQYIVAPAMEEVATEYFPHMPPIHEMRGNISLLLVNQQVPFQNSRPQMPNVIGIGGIHCQPANPLPKEFSDFVSKSEDGFVVFSLGSAVDGSKMPNFILEALLQGFGRLKQRVIWKIQGITGNIPHNIMISKWLPQQDLLGHPLCKLAIMHGGLMSLQEAIYHGVPVLGLPLGVDRDSNLAKAVQLGFAKTLDWRTLTTDIVFETISQMIANDSYRLQAEKYSLLSRDTMRHPRETGAFWVEYVIRHKGAHHLKSVAGNLNLMQYLLIDIIAIVFVLVVIFIVLTYVVVKTCYAKATLSNVSKGNKLKLT